MARRKPPILRQRIFEARYEQGYRYLDRCGDTMLILEKLLTEDSSLVWLPGEAIPTGARLECPDLDLVLLFHSSSMVIEQNPVGDTHVDFDALAETILGVLVGRFDLHDMRRFGFRQVNVIATDSLDEAGEQSVRVSPVDDWRSVACPDFKPTVSEISSTFELPGLSKGVRVVTKQYSKIGAEAKIDERLKLPPHHLPTGQREALLERLKRAKKREQDPECGLAIDIDYYWMWPPRDWSVREFLGEAKQEADRLVQDLLQRAQKP